MSSIKMFFAFLKELLGSSHIILELTKADFKKKYLGSYLGILWAFVHPAVYIVVVWFVFEVGFRSQPLANFPFVLWMLTAIMPWFFFSDCLQSATTSIIENGFLLKKMVFSMGMLPIIKILSALIIHAFFVLVIFIMFMLYGFPPSLYNLQVFYYLFCTIALLLGLTWLTSSLTLFLKDTPQIVTMILQLAFWMTPIFWSTKNLSNHTLNLIKLNPIYYIVEGYRESFIYKTWFWQSHYMLTLYFWCVTGFFFVIGGLIFRRLRPHFADVI
ncbi:ABC transporter permease [Geomonas anaerohicana]|uniref:Transport permease protein n=1 Tax=Geomonas anaerohicana TaxID=2798583 RepID=A0ABS0YGW5_9BACT|nr:ABC transporter permease [Geomonas anaerohicana]MBJ6751572.1 ABC transporter permease [Geomonas anaerohicana]